MAKTCCSPFGLVVVRYCGQTFFLLQGYPDMSSLLVSLDALCYEGCDGHGTANGLPQLEWNWPKEAMNISIWAVNHFALLL